MPFPCSPTPDPFRSLLNRAGMICRQMSLNYEDNDPARVALLNAARNIEALEIPTLPTEENALAEIKKILQDACDRSWKDETLLQTANIASNAIYWRDREIENLKRERDARAREACTFEKRTTCSFASSPQKEIK